MKRDVELVGGVFDGRAALAYDGVTEFWKRDGDREYLYVRINERQFRYDRRWRKTKKKYEPTQLPTIHQENAGPCEDRQNNPTASSGVEEKPRRPTGPVDL